MNHDNRTGSPNDGPELGASFAEHTAHNVGASFAATTSSPRDPNLRADGTYVKPRRIWPWILAVLVLVALVFVFYRSRTKTNTAAGSGAKSGAAKGGNGRGQQGPAAITTGQSKTGNINLYVDALGTVTPTSTVTVYSQITGRVMAVYYREGQLVHKGQPLVDIDPAPYEATLKQAEGTLKHDQGVLAEAKIDLARYQAAFAKNAIARQMLEDQEQIVVQDEGTLTADEGTVAYDKVQLAYCHIASPINGKVGLRLVDPGNIVFSGSSSTLVVITQLQPITVVFNVSEDDLPQVQVQLKNRKVLQVDSFDRANDKILDTGKLDSLNNQVDTTTGTVKFRASFPNHDLQLFPNQFVNARLRVSTLQNTVLVPSVVIQHNGTASFVYLVKPGANNTTIVVVQPVTVVTNNDSVTAITGIAAGVTLATSGFDRLENNVPVLVRNDQGGQKSSQTSNVGNTAP